MNRVLRVLLALAMLGVLWAAFIGGTLLLLPPAKIAAQPPPDKSPVAPTVESPTEPPTEEPTTEEPTEPPTEEPTEEPTEPPTKPPVEEPAKEPAAKPNPNCQSVLEGTVTNQAGQAVAGASVKIQGEDWSRGMLSDDNGRFGFGGLCPGSVTVMAALPGQQMSAQKTVELDGKTTSQVDLRVSQGGGTQPTSTPQPATATRQQAEATATPEPSMPSTGFQGWILVGVALLGTLALILTGARQIVVARSRTRD